MESVSRRKNRESTEQACGIDGNESANNYDGDDDDKLNMNMIMNMKPCNTK